MTICKECRWFVQGYCSNSGAGKQAAEQLFKILGIDLNVAECGKFKKRRLTNKEKRARQRLIFSGKVEYDSD